MKQEEKKKTKKVNERGKTVWLSLSGRRCCVPQQQKNTGIEGAKGFGRDTEGRLLVGVVAHTRRQHTREKREREKESERA
jgi:hypothetical protein